MIFNSSVMYIVLLVKILIIYVCKLVYFLKNWVWTILRVCEIPKALNYLFLFLLSTVIVILDSECKRNYFDNNMVIDKWINNIFTRSIIWILMIFDHQHNDGFWKSIFSSPYSTKIRCQGFHTIIYNNVLSASQLFIKPI